MRTLLPDKEQVYHLQEYAVWRNENGTYEYMAWDDKAEKLMWIRGGAMIVEDVLCLKSIESDGEEESMETKLDVRFELTQFPKWDRTKYCCVVLGEKVATLIQYCETGEPLKAEGEDYEAAKKMLAKNGILLQSGDA
jgi:hypothetical protein